MNQNFGYWVLSGMMWLGFLAKAPGLRRTRDPLYVTVCAVLFLAGVTFCCANPDVVGFLNKITGIPNFSAPLVYSMLTLESSLVVTLLVYWREGSIERAKKWALRLQAAYAMVILGIIVLFIAGDAPVERRVDFEVFYADTPFIREMILLYLTAHIVASVMATALCARWAAGVTGPPWLRRGLRLLIIGFALNLGVGLPKLLAMIGRWSGHNWDAFFASIFQVCAFACTLFTAIGFTLPMIGGLMEQIRSDVREFRALGPLWRELRGAIPGVAASLPVSWWNIELRLTRRAAEIQDGRLALRPYRSIQVAAAAATKATAMNMRPDLADASVEAAVLTDAMQQKAFMEKRGLPRLNDNTTPLPRLDRNALILVSRAVQSGQFTHSKSHASGLESPVDGPLNA